MTKRWRKTSSSTPSIRLSSYLLMKFSIALLLETNSTEETFGTASRSLSSEAASVSSVMTSSTNATISFWFSRSAISALIFTDSRDTLPMIMRHAIMIVTDAKDMKP